MERNDDSLGTVYYAISLCIAVLALFVLKWKIFPLISILTMAYGDGLAALIGRKYGQRPLYGFASGKTPAGSATVFVLTFLITLLSLIFVGDPEILARHHWSILLLISLINALLSSFIEAAGTKGCDNLTLPLGSGLFASFAFYLASPVFYLYFILSASLLLWSLKKKWLTANGAVAAILVSITLFLLGGVWIALSLHLFYILGSLVSKIKNENKKAAGQRQEHSGARSWIQVLCNSLPACLLVWLQFFMPEQLIFSLLALSVFSAAAADTFSSELGTLTDAKVFNILIGQRMPRGLSGGVSFPGFLAGLLGSLLLSLPAIPQFGVKGFLFISLIGFLGSIIDSFLGALFQRKYLNDNGELSDKLCRPHQKPAKGFTYISNNTVNLLSLSLIALIGHLANLLYQFI